MTASGVADIIIQNNNQPKAVIRGIQGQAAPREAIEEKVGDR